MASPGRVVGRVAAAGACLGAVVLGAVAAPAVETRDPVRMERTTVVLKLDAGTAVDVRKRSPDRTPLIQIDFPRRQVVSSLPEHSRLSQGVIQSIAAVYEPRRPDASQRFLRSVRVLLTAPYASRVRSESGRVLIEIDHPASVGGGDIEVGLRGGSIISGMARTTISDRFRAMQDALTRARPSPVTFSMTLGSPGPEVAARGGPAGVAEEVVRPPGGARPHPGTPARPHVPWAGLGLIGLLAAAGLWVAVVRPAGGARTPGSLPAGRSSGLQLIDHLVWRALERQGYRLVAERDEPALGGTVRVMEKDGTTYAQQLLGQARIIDQQAVEAFAARMRAVQATRGMLVASGTFTVPAQREAKRQQIGVIGREQLAELLGVGAAVDYLTAQVESYRGRWQEADAALGRYEEELSALRQQRNDASWFLGEERAKTAALEAQVADLTGRLQQAEFELAQWLREAEALRRQWEESQWYLGEMRLRGRHLEEQLDAVRPVIQRVEAADRSRDEAGWQLAEEQTRRAALEVRLEELERDLAQGLGRERALQHTLEQLGQELAALRSFGERRTHLRLPVAGASVELWEGTDTLLFAGALRDLSRGGFGVDSPELLPSDRSLHVRVHLPGRGPVESRARIVWQRDLGDAPGHQSGCRFTRLPEEGARSILEALA